MKKIKIVSLLLAMLMVFTVLTGCGEGKADDNSVQSKDSESADSGSTATENDSSVSSVESEIVEGYMTSKQAFTEKMSELLDLSKYDELKTTESLNSDGSKSYESFYYSKKYSERTDYSYDFDVAFDDGTEFTMPVSYKDMKAKGWTYFMDSDANQTLEAGYMTPSVDLVNSKGQQLSVWVLNDSDKAQKLSDCIISGFQILRCDRADAIKFTVCDTLNNSSTLEEIFDKLGTPNSAYYAIHYKDGKYSYSELELNYSNYEYGSYGELSFTISGDNNYVVAIDFGL